MTAKTLETLLQAGPVGVTSKHIGTDAKKRKATAIRVERHQDGRTARFFAVLALEDGRTIRIHPSLVHPVKS